MDGMSQYPNKGKKCSHKISQKRYGYKINCPMYESNNKLLDLAQIATLKLF